MNNIRAKFILELWRKSRNAECWNCSVGKILFLKLWAFTIKQIDSISIIYVSVPLDFFFFSISLQFFFSSHIFSSFLTLDFLFVFPLLFHYLLVLFFFFFLEISLVRMYNRKSCHVKGFPMIYYGHVYYKTFFFSFSFLYKTATCHFHGWYQTMLW